MRKTTIQADVLVLGAGLTGLSAASVLGSRAIVLEREKRPGGLVRTECFNGYWFDHVIHLLYFADPRTQEQVTTLSGPDLVPCQPIAWVECSAGTVRFPFQMHLGGLDCTIAVDCIRDFVQVAYGPVKPPPRDFQEMLLHTFGRTMCEIFFFPYNRKMWKRPLDTLAPSGFQWNIVRPNLDEVLRGTLCEQTVIPSYNAAGWYPRPPREAPVRGMEVLSRALASQVADLRLDHTVQAIDLEAHTVTARNCAGPVQLRYRHRCLSTIPLPNLIAMCRQVPTDLREACARLKRNRVLTAAFSIRGPRPTGRGHWRYYTDESLIFSRLVHLHEFDPQSAPSDGWPLLAEITEPAEQPMANPRSILERAKADVIRAGGLPTGCCFIDAHLLLIDPAYVVFSVSDQPVVERARAFLVAHDVEPLGRYGRWEYSSMAQVMRDGFAFGEQTAAALHQEPIGTTAD